MNRVVLINRNGSPTRTELATGERKLGELLFVEFPELEYAGWVICYTNKLAVNWIIPDSIMNKFCEFAKKFRSNDYEIAVYAPGTTRHGGQCEDRII